MIIALGESIVAIGVGAEGIELGAGELLAAALGVIIAAALWWIYFDDALEQVSGAAARAAGRAARATSMARDAFSFLHLPLVAGIVLLALGVKKTLEHVDDPLKLVAAAGLCGGVALYLAADVAFRRRCLGHARAAAPRRGRGVPGAAAARDRAARARVGSRASRRSAPRSSPYESARG